MQKQFNGDDGNNVVNPSQKQKPGLYQSKDRSWYRPVDDKAGDEGDDAMLENEGLQNRVTNDADPTTGKRQKEDKEKSFYKNDLPDDVDEDAVDEDADAVDEPLTKEGISEKDGKPEIDADGNEIGGQG